MTDLEHMVPQLTNMIADNEDQMSGLQNETLELQNKTIDLEDKMAGLYNVTLQIQKQHLTASKIRPVDYGKDSWFS